MAFYGYHGSKCTEDKDAIQKYHSTDRKWEIYLQGQSFLCRTVSNAKDLQKVSTTEIRIIRKRRKISDPCFQSKFEVGKKKIFLHNDTILAALKKNHKFSHTSPFHPHTKQQKTLSTISLALSFIPYSHNVPFLCIMCSMLWCNMSETAPLMTHNCW
jgi:hypothetical protein